MANNIWYKWLVLLHNKFDDISKFTRDLRTSRHVKVYAMIIKIAIPLLMTGDQLRDHLTQKFLFQLDVATASRDARRNGREKGWKSTKGLHRTGNRGIYLRRLKYYVCNLFPAYSRSYFDDGRDEKRVVTISPSPRAKSHFLLPFKYYGARWKMEGLRFLGIETLLYIFDNFLKILLNGKIERDGIYTNVLHNTYVWHSIFNLETILISILENLRIQVLTTIIFSWNIILFVIF